jgi:hypothetical protein
MTAARLRNLNHLRHCLSATSFRCLSLKSSRLTTWARGVVVRLTWSVRCSCANNRTSRFPHQDLAKSPMHSSVKIPSSIFLMQSTGADFYT